MSDCNTFKDEMEELRNNLLDMSLRNSLLNFKPRSMSIKIVDEDIASLYDLIVVKESKMEFLPKSEKEHSIDLGEEYVVELVDNTWKNDRPLKDSHLDNYLQTEYIEKDLKKKLRNLSRNYKTIIEEQGYNNFFLALGFLEWQNIDYDDIIYKAPLVLVPMVIKRDSLSSPFKVYWDGSEVRSNLSLIYKLKEQGIDIPDFDEFNSKDELISYFNVINERIKHEKDWKINNEIYFSNFSFKKFIMFKDLDSDNWENICTNSVINLFNNVEDEIFEEYGYSDYGSEKSLSINSEDTYLVLDADSSQINVLNDVKANQNVVVEGPPGTGKSQTIVNLIAELMAEGKKILFVSEKKTALDVVKSRLDNIGLGEGCLELHGKNSNKKDFLKELEYTLNLDSVSVKNYFDFHKLDILKHELNEYSNVLHDIYGNTDLTIYNLIGIFNSNKQILKNCNQNVFDLSINHVNDLNEQFRREIVNNLDELQKDYEEVSPILNNVWSNVVAENLKVTDVKTIAESLLTINKDLNSFIELYGVIEDVVGLCNVNTFNINLIEDYFQLLDSNLKLLKEEDDLDSIIEDISEFQSLTNNINLDIFDLDLKDMQTTIDDLIENINSLNINMEIMDKEDFKSMAKNFKANKKFIDESNLEFALKDPNLEMEFIEFKSKRNSFILKRLFDGNFKKIRNKFKHYYSYDVDDDKIEKDFEKLINANNELTKLRNKIFAYSNIDLNDDKIIIESEKLISWVSDLDKIREDLSSYEFNVQNDVIKKEINNLVYIKNLLQKIEKYDELGNYYFANDWNSINSNVDILINRNDKIKKFKEVYCNGFFKDTVFNFIKKDDFNILNEYYEDLSIFKSKIFNTYDYLNEKLHFRGDLQYDLENVNIFKFKEDMDDLLKSSENLNYFRLFSKHCNEFTNEYTEELIDLIKSDKVNSKTFVNLFYYNFANVALKDAFSNQPLLDEFTFKKHSKKIDEFKKLDDKIIQLNRIRIRELLYQNRPNIHMRAGNSSSLGILQTEMSKKRRIKPIRKILSEAYDVISLIKPCFMMSPISIAQFLSPKVFESYFDYVIFDEASQVKVEDAMGAMLRGKHYVIMGDTKQLPPTNFFEKERDIDEESDDSDLLDIESILHKCKTKFKTRMLRWHYRSRHQSLIEVSNMEFYDNKLYVFPSPTKYSDDVGLKFEYVPFSVYNRGTTSNNVEEAEKVIDYAFSCIEKYGDSKSLGIGTFNVKQRDTILDVLEEKIKDRPDLESFFNEDNSDSFFVKNLENIQGDEKDIIIISVGYGKDINGKLTLNFGPLNKEGGERRLNVLISRAKEQCIVFSNFKSADMYTNENTPRGVEALKTFLYYAENQEFPSNYHTGEDFDSPFEESVYNFLTDNGFIVEKQVGCAGYSIDLAIVDKKDANNYILAIECDGASYHSSSLARDRDKLRQRILENLGWTFYRVWSTDWFLMNKAAKKRLLNAIKKAQKNSNKSKKVKKVESKFKIDDDIKIVKNNKADNLNKFFTEYERYNCKNSKSDVKIILKDLIKVESPIHVKDIYESMKYILDKRATAKFKTEINDILIYLLDSGSITKNGNFYQDKTFNINDLKVRKREKPKIEHICDDEIIKAIFFTLKLQGSSSKEDLIKISSSYLGFKKLTQKVKDKFEELLEGMKLNECVVERNNKIQIMKS